MVFIEHHLGIRQVVLDLGLLAPGQVDQGVDVVAHHGRLGRHGRHQLELLELGIRLLAGLLGHLGREDLLLELLHVGAVFTVAEFLLDGLDLFVQVVLALALLHLALDAAADALLHLQDVDLMLEQVEQLLQALGHVGQVEHSLLGIQLERQVGGDGVGQTAGVVDATDGRQDLGRDLLVELDVLIELLRHGATQGLDLGSMLGLRRDRRHFGHEMLAGLRDRDRRGTLQPLDQHLHGAVGQLEHLQDAGNAADLEHVLGLGLVLAGRLLGDQHDLAAGFHRGFQGLDGLGAPDEQRDDHVREHDHVTQRQQRQRDRVGGEDGMSGHEDLSFSGRYRA
mmetsp:Transcript_15238/g.28562  ORF Transcript_15238/g.28562 Transcript_15238/m.28562 type:complete len:338 (-) Transcript_15238:699-1712(-)